MLAVWELIFVDSDDDETMLFVSAKAAMAHAEAVEDVGPIVWSRAVKNGYRNGTDYEIVYYHSPRGEIYVGQVEVYQ